MVNKEKKITHIKNISNYTVKKGDKLLFVDASHGPVRITVPSEINCIEIKKVDDTDNDVIVERDPDTIALYKPIIQRRRGRHNAELDYYLFRILFS